MRHIFKFAAVCALAVFTASCTKELSENSAADSLMDEELSFVTFTADCGNSSKVAYDGATKVSWVEGDVISVVDAAGLVASYTVAASDISASDASKVTFTVETGAGPYKAVVAKGEVSCTDGVVKVSNALDGTFASADVLACSSSDCNLQFQHIFGIVGFSSTKEGVDKVHFSAHANEAFTYAGPSFTITFPEDGRPQPGFLTNIDNNIPVEIKSTDAAFECNGLSEYYFPLVPGEYKGFDMVLGSGAKASFLKTDKSLTATAGKIVKLGDITDKLSDAVFYESFDGNYITGGNDGYFSPTMNATIQSDNEGWTYSTGVPAMTCVRFGSSKNQGIVTSPALGLVSGKKYVMSFKAACYNHNTDRANPMLVEVVGNGSVSESSFKLMDAWQYFEVTIVGADPESKIAFKGSTAVRARGFVDQIIITEAEGEAPVEAQKVSVQELLDNAEAGVLYELTGSATGIEGKSFILTDETGSIKIDNIDMVPFEENDNVTVTGELQMKDSEAVLANAAYVSHVATPKLKVSTTSLSAKCNATSSGFLIDASSNVEWTVTSSNPDIVATPASGTGPATVVLAFPANTVTEPVTSTITISSSTEGVKPTSCQIAFTQDAYSEIKVGKTWLAGKFASNPYLAYGSDGLYNYYYANITDASTNPTTLLWLLGTHSTDALYFGSNAVFLYKKNPSDGVLFTDAYTAGVKSISINFRFITNPSATDSVDCEVTVGGERIGEVTHITGHNVYNFVADTPKTGTIMVKFTNPTLGYGYRFIQINSVK